MTKGREDWQSYKGNGEIAEPIHTMKNSREVFRLIVQRWPKLQGELLSSHEATGFSTMVSHL